MIIFHFFILIIYYPFAFVYYFLRFQIDLPKKLIFRQKFYYSFHVFFIVFLKARKSRKKKNTQPALLLWMNTFTFNCTINHSWLIEVNEDIMTGKTTMAEVARCAKFDTENGTYVKAISVDTLHRYFKQFGLATFETGRKGRASFISDTASTFIKQNHKYLKIGTRKMYELCQDMNIPTSRRMVEEFYKRNFTENLKPKEADIYRTTYVCQQVNSAWHGDIHYLKTQDDEPKRKYLFALIDDASRYIIAYEINETKSCAFVANVFQQAIIKVGRPPLIFWSDNGKENIGPEMQDILNENDIHHVRTKPFSPESNGKIERFWQAINKAVAGKTKWDEINEAIDIYIQYYNNYNHHRGLEKVGSTYPTPAEVFFDPSLQASDRDHATISVDGKITTLAYFCKERQD